MHGAFVMAIGEATELLETSEHILDQMTGTMVMLVENTRFKPMRTRWNFPSAPA
jgi:hypothetical protein